MGKTIIALILALGILALSACNTPNSPIESSENNLSAESPSDSSEESGAPEDDPQPESAPKKEYDKNEVYKHVFEDVSVKIEYSDLESIEPDCENGEGLVLIHLGDPDELEKADYYKVKRVTSKTSDNCSKYSMAPSLQTSGSAGGRVTDDYHEAYLDVMLENLTFSECERIPDYADGVYLLAGIADLEAKRSYSVCEDGHVYYSEGDASFKSDQKVDAPYLYVMALMTETYKYSNAWNRSYYNENLTIDEPFEEREVQSGDKTVTYYVTEDGTAYRINEPTWIYCPHPLGASIGMVAVYAQRTIVYEDAELNGIFD